jgi:hypothetical protein
VLWGHPHLTPDAGARRAALGWVYSEARGAAPGGEALQSIDAAGARWIVRRVSQRTPLEVLRGVEEVIGLGGGFELVRVRLPTETR